MSSAGLSHLPMSRVASVGDANQKNGGGARRPLVARVSSSGNVDDK